jgi:hypothetical protein
MPGSEKKKTEPTRWICSVTFLKNGRYPMPPVVHTIVATAPHVAAARAIATARREVMPGKRIDEVTVKVKRATVVASS